ncbi:hypothetical protein [Mucilaginibacter sp.]|uniref:hypothetical protein n=1 Tax=Mucilaginibacter sp. TaxID=1882438 RepID=UPI0028486E65|nr:hypothetical protein [Mucilaginibacter sp.]MDR3695602.1 hypothetical protein [Mucilaginibacter sp.]
MSLDTVLKIGKIYRQSKQGLEQHRYIKSIWKDVEIFKKNKDAHGNSIEPIFYNLPVISSGSDFDFDNLSVINDEDKKKSLKYLNFKTSDKDSEKRYLFGDLIYANYIDKKGVQREGGNYKMEKVTKGKTKSSSFGRATEEAQSLENTLIGTFRKAFENNIFKIEQLLLSHPAVVIHFAFEDNSMWHETQNTLDLINNKLIEGFIINHSGIQKTVLNKFLFKTIGGLNPDFSEDSAYKIKSFDSPDDVIDLIYGVSISEKVLINVRDIGIVILPNGDNLNADILDRFFYKSGLQQVTDAEPILNEENRNDLIKDDVDSLFGDLTENELPANVKYDIVFIKPAGLSSPSIDMLEISHIEKSFLRNIYEKITGERSKLKEISNITLGKSKLKPKYDIKESFFEILGQKGKNQKKFSFHLLKVLPQIYTDTYYRDPVLLPAFIEKAERNIRDGFSNFNVLKYDFYFLTRIQKQNNMQSITESKSFHAGEALGTMARPFAAWRDDCPIKSFEKNYVGNLTRRIVDLAELIKFANFLNEKLTIHEKNYKDVQEAYLNLIKNIKALEILKEKYDKNTCALGFFESYFSH